MLLIKPVDIRDSAASTKLSMQSSKQTSSDILSHTEPSQIEDFYGEMLSPTIPLLKQNSSNIDD